MLAFIIPSIVSKVTGQAIVLAFQRRYTSPAIEDILPIALRQLSPSLQWPVRVQAIWIVSLHQSLAVHKT